MSTGNFWSATVGGVDRNAVNEVVNGQNNLAELSATELEMELRSVVEELDAVEKSYQEAEARKMSLQFKLRNLEKYRRDLIDALEHAIYE